MKLIRNLVNRIVGVGGHVLVNPQYHWGVSALTDIRRLAKSQNTTINRVLDIGAHFGEWGRTAIEAFPAAEVISFEPFPESFAVLQKNLSGNGRHTAVNVAAGDCAGELDFFLYQNSCLNSLTQRSAWSVKSNWNSMASIKVQVVRLDDWCEQANLQHVDLLKVDTEGFDLQVLQGAEGLFRQGRVRFVFVEFNDLQSIENATGGSLLAVDRYLRDFGFRFINTYLDSVGTKAPLFITSNALFMLQPSAG
jgi:FkbM family methyltransferase